MAIPREHLAKPLGHLLSKLLVNGMNIWLIPFLGSQGDAPPAFRPARPINQADLAILAERMRRRVLRWC